MPMFRCPRERAEIEVSHLEAKGYRITAAYADGDEVALLAYPLWTSVHETRPQTSVPQYERPEWFNEASAVIR